jgi:hypothetical protein
LKPCTKATAVARISLSADDVLDGTGGAFASAETAVEIGKAMAATTAITGHDKIERGVFGKTMGSSWTVGS